MAGYILWSVFFAALGGCIVNTDRVWILRGFPIPSWAGWIFILAAIIVAFIAVRARLRGDDKPKKYTEEDYAKAEAEMDAMYEREYGEPPEKPGKEGNGRTP